MGGSGSGGHNQRKRCLEQFRRLDMGYLQKHDLLPNGVRSTITWTNRDGTRASIRVVGGRDHVVLGYRARVGDEGDWTDVLDRFDIDWSPRHFGGAQAFFRCCKCNRRARFLYLASIRFRCRMCHRLVHASSQEQSGNRATRKNQKLRARLGASQALGDYAPRPKGMHETTYQRYLDRIHDAECEINDDIIRVISRITRTHSRLGGLPEELWP